MYELYTYFKIRHIYMVMKVSLTSIHFNMDIKKFFDLLIITCYFSMNCSQVINLNSFLIKTFFETFYFACPIKT